MIVADAYHFCPRCGQPYGSSTGDLLLTCLSCGLQNYINPKPTAGFLLRNDEGAYLLTVRGIEPKKGLWDLPGGFVNNHENFEQAARREAKEELGVELTELHYLGSYLDMYHFQDVDFETLNVMFVSSIAGGQKPQPADDVTSYQFFGLSELPRDQFAFESMQYIFLDLQKFNSTIEQKNKRENLDATTKSS